MTTLHLLTDDHVRDIPTFSDFHLLGLARAGEILAEDELVRRHGGAVTVGTGADELVPDHEQRVRALMRTSAAERPVRIAWLSLIAGTELSPRPDERVWQAFSSLPASWQSVVWHHYVEGDDLATIGRLLALAPDDVVAAVASAQAGMRRAVTRGRSIGTTDACFDLHASVDMRAAASIHSRQLGVLSEHCRHCADCLPWVLDLMTLQFGLRDVLALRVLGSAFVGAYLWGKPDPQELDLLGAGPARRAALVRRGKPAGAVVTVLGVAAAAVSTLLVSPYVGLGPSLLSPQQAVAAGVSLRHSQLPDSADESIAAVGSAEPFRLVVRDIPLEPKSGGSSVKPTHGTEGGGAIDVGGSGPDVGEVPGKQAPPVSGPAPTEPSKESPGAPSPSGGIQETAGPVTVDLDTKDGSGSVTVDPPGPAVIEVPIPEVEDVIDAVPPTLPLVTPTLPPVGGGLSQPANAGVTGTSVTDQMLGSGADRG